MIRDIVLPATLLAVAQVTFCQPEDSGAKDPVVTAIPVAMYGRWGLVPNDCDPTRDDAKGLMKVSVAALTFYESRGLLEEIEEASPTRLDASFAFSGEGVTWERHIVLELDEDKGTLTRSETDPDAGPLELVYSRCE